MRAMRSCLYGATGHGDTEKPNDHVFQSWPGSPAGMSTWRPDADGLWVMPAQRLYAPGDAHRKSTSMEAL